MKIGIVSNVNSTRGLNVNFSAKTKMQKTDEYEFKTKEQKTDFKTKVKNFFKNTKMVLFALVSSALTGLAVYGATSGKNRELKNENKVLKNENDNLQNSLNSIVLPENFESEVENKIQQLNDKELSYSPTEPIISNKSQNSSSNTNPETVLPDKYQKPKIRLDSKQLEYPVFKQGQPYNFEFPTSNEVKITKNNKEFKPTERTLTTVSESYADSLLWDNDKIARDLLQNFYDGHGGTLDGVKFNVTPTEKGKYKIRIEGKSTYTADKAILLGESSKKDDKNAAGNYGEGLKMVVLKLLREKGANEVNIASNNWNVNWNFEKNDFDKNVLAYQLDEIPPIDGNYIEFDTDNVEFIETIIKSFNRFYHYNNPSFKNPDFENDILGINLSDKNDNGKIFIAGQAFEVNGKYENLSEMNIYIKQKPPVKYKYDVIFDPSRDRTSLNSKNLEALGKWIVSDENMSKEDAIKLLHSLKDYWDVGTKSGIFKHRSAGVSFISGIYEGIGDRKDLNIKFPDDKYIADSFWVSEGLKDMYKQAGYKICNSNFKDIGMRSIETLIDETRQHKPIEPTVQEKNKLLILRDAIKLLAPVLKEDNLFTDEELDTKIFIYDRKSNNEDKAYKDVTGEAIIEKDKCLGFWLDRTSLKEEDFSKILGTSLHELTHKFGGDSSEIFSYKLTDVMRKVFAAINSNPNLATQLKVLESAWIAQNKEA